MNNKNKTFGIFLIALCLCWLAACAKDKWNGETYSGKVTIGGVEPDGSPVEKFKLATAKVPGGKQKVVTLDAENKVLGNCTMPLDDFIKTEDSLERKEGPFFIVDKSDVICSSMVEGNKINVLIHSGEVQVNTDAGKNDVRFWAIGIVEGTSESHTFEIKAERQN